MKEVQKGRCLICTKIPTKQLVVDHCHTTGKVRGLLCDKCNFLLGLANDQINVLQNAIAYLESSCLEKDDGLLCHPL